MTEETKPKQELEPKDRNFTGLLLIGLGLLALLYYVANISSIGLLILPVLGVSFLGWGFYTRRFGFIIPGCILLGLAIPLLLVQAYPNLDSADNGGIFVLGLGIGFVAITVFAPFFKERRAWWPLIPGGILGIVGVLMMFGDRGEQILQALNVVWPIALLLIGLYILFWPRLRRD